jgi:UDP-N-acetyl-D-mannosaminuronic acid dehydrogenase
MIIGVIGLGYVGLTLSLVMADSGHRVYGIDREPGLLACLSEGKAPFYEPGIEDIIARVSGESFFAGPSFPARVRFDGFVITVGTPLREDGATPNFEHILGAIDALLPRYDGGQLIVLRSTVSVGTTNKYVRPYLRSKSGIAKSGIKEPLLAFCPERTIEGKALAELRELPQVIGGDSAEAVSKAQALFAPFTKEVIIADSIEEAELIKLLNNVYRDMSFAMGNAFSIIAQNYGVGGDSAITKANYHYPRSNIALPGPVGGPCISKDSRLLTYGLKSAESEFVNSGRRINAAIEDYVVDWVRRQTRTGPTRTTIGISGLAFKGRPDTADTRNSTGVSIAKKLSQLGYTLRLHDFVVPAKSMRDLDLGTVASDLGACGEGCDILIILNNNSRYSEAVLDLGGKAVLDLWGVLPGDGLVTMGDVLIR